MRTETAAAVAAVPARRFAATSGIALLVLAACILSSAAGEAQLIPSSASVGQGGEIPLSYGTCNSQAPGANEWQWTLSGQAGGSVQEGTDVTATCWSGIFTAGYTAGTYTVSLSQNGVAVGSATITVTPLSIVISGQTSFDENAYYYDALSATLSGMASPNGSDYAIVWSISPVNDMSLSAGSTPAYNVADETITAGLTAGTYVVTAASAREPAVSASWTITVLPPVVSVTPAFAVVIPGQSVTFTCTDSNVPPGVTPGCSLSSNDPWLAGESGGEGPLPIWHQVGHPGGTFQLVFAGAWGGQATASLTVVAVSVTPSSILVPPGTSRQFFGDVTGSQQALQWSTTVPGATITSEGLLTVPAGTTPGSYAVTAQTVGSPVSPATAAVTVAASIPVSAVVVSPARSVIPSGQEEPLAVVVLGQNDEPHPDQAVSWSVAGPAAAIMGASGIFTGPATPGVYTVTATSQADPTKSGTAMVTVGEDLMVQPAAASLAPGASQQFTAQVSGVANPQVTWNVEEGAAGGALSAGGLYTAPATAGVYHVMAVSAAGGDAVQGIATVSVGASPLVSIVILPAEAPVPAGGVQQFSASVTGVANTAVTWSASAGTIDPTGLFTAPSSYGTVTITATSQADPQAQSFATAVVSSGVPGQAFQYDANGNLLSDGLRTYEWDAENRLSAINIGTHRSEFGYDAFGHRVMIVEIDNGNVTSKRHYVWLGDQLAEEHDATATSATIPTTIAVAPPATPEAPTRSATPAIIEVAPAVSGGRAVTEAAPTPAGDNAAFVAQTVPTTMVAGGVYSVSVTMSNNGTTTWTAAHNYRLGSSDPQNNMTWGLARVYLASSDAIAPGQQKTFTFDVTAPATAGSYNFQWQMIEENVAWIGDPTANLAITVVSAANANLAQFIAQSVPTKMVAGGVYTVSITMQNAGTNVWTPSSNHHLGSQDPEDNTTWRGNRVFLSTGDSIAQGQQKTFTFTVTAPASAGTYPFQWQMVQEGVAWFGDLTPVVEVTVVAGSTQQLAQYVSQSVPAMMSVGMSYQVSITLENAGTATWTAAASYRLGSANPQNNLTWGVNRVYLASSDSIAQGQEKTFTFTVTAPSVPGTYYFQWQMIQEGVTWFGDVTPNVAVSVIVPVEPVLYSFFLGGLQTGGANYYFSYDHLGSIREVTDVNGNVVARYDYDPWGRQTVVQGAAFELAYAGYYYHQPSGLYLTKFRAYDPDLGRWASRDPLGEGQGQNLYRYVGDDPVNEFDPLGLGIIYNDSCDTLAVKPEEGNNRLVDLPPHQSVDADGIFNGALDSCDLFGDATPGAIVYKNNDWHNIRITGGCGSPLFVHDAGYLDSAVNGGSVARPIVGGEGDGWKGINWFNNHPDWSPPRPIRHYCCKPLIR